MDQTVRRNRRSPALAEFCRDALRRKNRDASHVVAHLERAREDEQFAQRVPVLDSVEAFLDGSGKALGENALKLLESLFCDTDVERQAYARLVDALKPNSIVTDKIDSVRPYRYLPVPYPPLSGVSQRAGEHDYFIDRLLDRMGQVAFLRWEVHEDLKPRVQNEEFDMDDRIAAVKSGRADVLVNLVSLPRLRSLHFITTPVSISLNGVVRDDIPDVDRVVDAALGLLSGLPDPSNPAKVPFKALIVSGEVGGQHVSWMNGRLKAFDRIKTETVWTLKHEKLAEQLLKSPDDEPLILFCDELTALGVLRAMKMKGRLLFPLNSDASIARSRRRRSLPVHQLGIGYYPDGEFASEIARIETLFRKFVEYEREMIAALYVDLYHQFTVHVRQCLEQSPDLYVGGVRRVRAAKVSQEYWPELIAENSRAHVRRCLQLSRRTIALHTKDDPWVPILSRARERVQTNEARDRRSIRASLMTALSMAAGLDPCVRKISTEAEVDIALKSRSQLRELLERDLDVDLPGGDEFFDLLEKAPRRASIERFVSVLQQVLEHSVHPTHVTVVLDRTKVAESVRREVDRRLRDWRRTEKPTTDQRLEMIGEAEFSMWIAVALGEPVGAITMRYAERSIDLGYLWVDKPMRSGNIGPLLVRKVIEAAAASNRCESVFFEDVGMSRKMVEWFEKLGFKEGKDGRYSYTLQYLNTGSQKASPKAPRQVPPKGRLRITPAK